MRRLLHLPVQPTVVSGWQAWDMLADDPDSILVDLGSIGSPDLRELNKVPHTAMPDLSTTVRPSFCSVRPARTQEKSRQRGWRTAMPVSL
jgi:hypothetical protein